MAKEDVIRTMLFFAAAACRNVMCSADGEISSGLRRSSSRCVHQHFCKERGRSGTTPVRRPNDGTELVLTCAIYHALSSRLTRIASLLLYLAAVLVHLYLHIYWRSL